MYNRYIPGPDGSYQKCRVADAQTHPCVPRPPAPPEPRPVGSFLKNLLPGSLDTGDLFVILLLLLIAGDSEKERNHALLTIFLYFFL